MLGGRTSGAWSSEANVFRENQASSFMLAKVHQMTIAGTRPVSPVSGTARQNDIRPRSGNALAILHLQEGAFDVKNCFSGFSIVSVSGAFVLQLGAMCSVAGDVCGAPKAGRKRCCPHGLEPGTLPANPGLSVLGRASRVADCIMRPSP